MRLIPAKNPVKGGVYFFTHCNPNSILSNGHEFLITSDFGERDSAFAVDLNNRTIVKAYKKELYEKSTHIYEVGDIVEDTAPSQKGRFFQVLDAFIHTEDYYKVKILKAGADSNPYYSIGEITNLFLKEHDTKLFIKGSLLK